MSKKKEKEEVVEENNITEIANDEKGNSFEIPKEYLEKRVLYSLGFRNIDTNIAFNVYDENTAELIKTNRGILSGSLIGYIGVSGAGKSTLATQHMANLIRPFIIKGDKRVKCHIFEVESPLPRPRFKSITNLTDKEIHDHLIWEERVSIDGLKELLAKIVATKDGEKRDKVMGYMNREVDVYYPTFIVVDAMSEIMPENLLEVDKKDNNMLNARQALELDMLFKKYMTRFAKYNINILYVCHIGTKFADVNNPMARPTRDWKAMKADINIKGGKQLQYCTDLGIFIEKVVSANEEATKKEASYLKSDHIMQAKLYKNRQGRPGDIIFLVADNDGFNPMKSFIYECTQCKIIESAGSVRKIQGWEENMRSDRLIPTFVENPDFRRLLYKLYDEEKKHVFEANRKSGEDRRKQLEILNMMSEEF